MSRPYTVPLKEFRREHIVINSRFIATLAPAFSIDEAREFHVRIKNEFGDASHNVTEYFSDDGEPGGTSGRPALAVLRGSGLGDAALVITRYFGGTLLGKGGLVRAYIESAQLVVRAAARGQKIAVHVAMIALPYNLLERLRLIVNRRRGEVVLGEDFGAEVTMTASIPVDSFDGFQNDLRELSAGKLQAQIIEIKETIVPL